ncbi:transcription termination/antitermination protein NusG [[Mycoplasma] mobile]|uniref:Transcription termination/antitermination protein NusG n=1 Tax=Mycoplasma mobile (strain ATCC 43663 / 163K / NCTC 11711) TaxID=267748 RepID=Q6KIE5_MYCM1|nr:transcription termination/antitermination protein NusG [[Mycoplasma] mobile]AAT27631.1 transcription antitermination factor [Mycoplasma mobile 163K]
MKKELKIENEKNKEVELEKNTRDDSLFHWYTISVVSGKEEKVLESLNNKIKSLGMGEVIKEIKIFQTPYLTEKELEKKRNGENFKVKQEKLYKGYIFMKMIMTDDVWFMVRNTENVTGLIGSSGKGTKPTPISERKFSKMLDFEKKKIEEFGSGNYNSKFKIGLVAKVLEGPFKDEEGIILENNDIKALATIAIESFGRKTPVEFEHKNLKVVSE